ncbi:MAG: GTP cyclohydrolase FolE2 [Fimbriimonadaceae bacterium]|nr:GTP cyclohydrolase FolE2 [Fimbriimonadaceae bacterium]
MTTLTDIQSQHDPRGVPIEEVGISGLRYPLNFDDGSINQATTAEIEMTVALPAQQRGTHMSRMVQVIDTHLQVVNPYDLSRFMKFAAGQLEADRVFLRVSMPLATRLAAPTSGEQGWQVHDIRLDAQWSADDFTLQTSATCDVTTLCPCSKAISDYGAHNQRSRVTLTVEGRGDEVCPASVSRLIELIQAAASCPVYPVVKRPDERTITMAAYDNPRFVEDLVRELSLSCQEMELSHSIDARNIESIHSHDAVARLSWSASDDFVR